MFQTAPRVKLRDLVAEQIKAFITREQLKPGDRLPTETRLAEQFGVSRLSIREATKSLEFLGIVEARPRRGLIVGSVNMDRVIEHLGFHPALLDVSPEQLIGTRVVIETGVTPYVAEQMQQNPELYQHLNDINSELRETKDLQRWMELDIAFHRALVNGSNLPPLIPFTQILEIFFRRFRESVKRGEWARGVESHQAIIDALRDHDPAQAALLLREHIESHKSRIDILDQESPVEQ